MAFVREVPLDDLVSVIDGPSPRDLTAIKEGLVAINSTRHPFEVSRPLGRFVCSRERADDARRKGTLRARQCERPRLYPA